MGLSINAYYLGLWQSKTPKQDDGTQEIAMTPFDDFLYLINSILLGEEPSIEDFILLIGTFVAFVAFVLWCCFPIVPKETNLAPPLHYETRYNQYRKVQDSDYNGSL